MKRNVTEETEAKIVEFCVGGKTMIEIAGHVGLQVNSVGRYLSRLQGKELIERIPIKLKRIAGGSNPSFYLTVGTEFNHPPLDLQEVAEQEPKWNEDFMKVAHKCLHLGAA